MRIANIIPNTISKKCCNILFTITSTRFRCKAVSIIISLLTISKIFDYIYNTCWPCKLNKDQVGYVSFLTLDNIENEARAFDLSNLGIELTRF